MEPERDEVYERIPWETLSAGGGQRQWLAYAVAGAVVLGALAYSFFLNRPPAPIAEPSPLSSTLAGPSTVPATSTEPATPSPPSTVASPIVVAEADLFAVDPERLVDQVMAHAEWLAVEYVAVDGSEVSRDVLGQLLPQGIPLPESPDGTQVFVDWTGVIGLTETQGSGYVVDVLVRSLLSVDGGAFVRQAPIIVTVPLQVGQDGSLHSTKAPSVRVPEIGAGAQVDLAAVPEDVVSGIADRGDVVGGVRLSDGSWEVVVMEPGADGVERPVTVVP